MFSTITKKTGWTISWFFSPSQNVTNPSHLIKAEMKCHSHKMLLHATALTQLRFSGISITFFTDSVVFLMTSYSSSSDLANGNNEHFGGWFSYFLIHRNTFSRIWRLHIRIHIILKPRHFLWKMHFSKVQLVYSPLFLRHYLQPTCSGNQALSVKLALRWDPLWLLSWKVANSLQGENWHFHSSPAGIWVIFWSLQVNSDIGLMVFRSFGRYRALSKTV